MLRKVLIKMKLPWYFLWQGDWNGRDSTPFCCFYYRLEYQHLFSHLFFFRKMILLGNPIWIQEMMNITEKEWKENENEVIQKHTFWYVRWVLKLYVLSIRIGIKHLKIMIWNAQYTLTPPNIYSVTVNNLKP